MNGAFILNLALLSVCPLLRLQEPFEELFEFQPTSTYHPGADVVAPMVHFKSAPVILVMERMGSADVGLFMSMQIDIAESVCHFYVSQYGKNKKKTTREIIRKLNITDSTAPSQ